MLGSKYLDINMVTNVHVSKKSMVGTLEHSFKSVDGYIKVEAKIVGTMTLQNMVTNVHVLIKLTVD